MTLFTPPAKAPVMIAAARERLVDAPHDTSPHRLVEGMVTSVLKIYRYFGGISHFSLIYGRSVGFGKVGFGIFNRF